MTTQLEIGQEATDAPGAVTWSFSVIGRPVAKGRPRFDRRSGRTYTPKKTREYEEMVGTIAAFRRPARWPLDSEYCVELGVYLPDARKRDIDNIAKCVLDALNGIAWRDDRQVANLHVTREIDRDNPRVEIRIEVLP